MYRIMDIDDFYIPNGKLKTRYKMAVEKLEHFASIFLFAFGR